MAIRWIDGFDLYNTTYSIGTSGRYAVINSAPAFASGRFTGQCVSIINKGFTFQPFGGSAVSTLAIGFAFQTDSVSGAGEQNFARMESSINGVQVDFRITATGAVRATRNGTVLGTSVAGTIVAGNWYYIELEITRHASAGAFKIYVNGGQVLNLTSQNTGNNDIDQITIRGDNNGATYKVDDLYVCDVATKLGERRIETLRPTADTAQKDLTPSTGTDNFAMVDETTIDSDTTYVSSATTGHKDLYDCADLSFTPASISAVQVTMTARKDDATLRQVRANLKSGATTVNGATRTMGTGYATGADLYENDPNTSAAWTPSNVNAVQIGPEIVA